MKTQLITIILVLFSNILFAQIKLDPELIDLAIKMKKEFPKQEYVSLGTSSIYNFSYGDSTVECEELLEEKIMSLNENVTFYEYLIFNDQVDIGFVYMKNYKGRKRKLVVKKEKYKSNGIFYDDASVATFNMFLTTRGDNATYFVETKIKDVKYFTKAYFHKSYPIAEVSLVLNIPDWLELELVEENFDGYDIIKSESYNSKDKINTITYKLKKAEAMLGGNYTISAVQELPHLLILSKSYKKKGKTNTLFNSTQDLYDWYASLIKEMDNKPLVFKDKVESLTADAKTDKEKVENIFYWVQDNTRYIAYEDGIMGFKPANADDVYNKRFGDCKGMANLTCSMLKEAGFDARLTWIGTKSIPYTYATPSLAVDNHMITTLFLDGEKYFLDATEKGVALGQYAYRIQGQDVLIEDGESYILDSVPEFGDEYNIKKTIYKLSLIDDKLFGSAIEEFHGEEKTNLYRSLGNVSKSELFERVSKYVSNYDKSNGIADLHISNYSNRSKPIIFEYKIVVENKITAVDVEKYFSLELDRKFSSMNVEENRNLGYDFQQKVHNYYEVTLSLPANYIVDYMPDSVFIDNSEFLFDVKYIYNKEENKIKYTRKIIVKNGVVSSSNFDTWNGAINKLKEIYNDQIILIDNQ